MLQLDAQVDQPAIICLQETFAVQSDTFTRLFPNSSIVISDRESGRGGGIATIVAESIPIVDSIIHEFFVGVVMGEKQTLTILLNVYIPPQTSKYAPTESNGYKVILENA